MEDIQNTPSPDVIVETAKRLPLAELDRLVDRVIAIRAERRAPHLTADEGALLGRVNKGLSAEDKRRLNVLIAERDYGAITPAELEELTSLTDRLELLHADRLAALAELASLRGITLDEVINQLGLRFPDHD